MKQRDRELGMGRDITRRDFLYGLGAASTAPLVPGTTLANEILALEKKGSDPFLYPPALTGLRGSHTGSFEVAHALAREGRSDWGPERRTDSTVYDLVVVGAGISGLSAAHFYRRQQPDARILILDNHDDFGGHAKRNEFESGGRTVLGYGGSQTLESPSGYSRVVKKLLRELGVDLNRFDTAYDQEFLRRNNLAGGVFFNRENWGADKLVRFDMAGLGGYLPLAPSSLSAEEAVQAMPLSDAARGEMLRLLTLDEDQIPDVPERLKEDYLYSMSYRDFLERHVGITEPDVFKALEGLTTDSCLGLDATMAGDAIIYSGLPGGRAAGLEKDDDEDPYIHHFPDGNASIARLLVRNMIPAVAPGTSMEDIVTAQFDYGKLDDPASNVRLRLNSTVIKARHDGHPDKAKRVQLSYVQQGKAYQVQAKNCVMACYNAMIPALCPELPEAQRKALAGQVKAPILYTNVALRNWQAWHRLGVGAFMAPGSYHINALLDFPVSLGDYRFTESPDEPVIVHMERFLHRPNQGLSNREQHRLGRHELLSTSFETIERSVREQLTASLSEGGFDPAKDIEAITVNRWAHGYTYAYDFLNEAYYDDWDDARYPHVQGRQPFGRITIANADAGADATLNVAVEQAYRAVSELG